MSEAFFTPRVTAWLEAVPGRSERLYDAHLRARGRVYLQREADRHGQAIADETASRHRLEIIGCIRRPDMQLPYERVEIIARARKLHREHGW